MIRYVLIEAFCAFSGYTDKAVRRKLESGVWLENQVWRKAPDGHILINLEGYYRWCEGQTDEDLKNEPTASESASTGEIVGVVRLFPSSRQTQISPTPPASGLKSSAK